MEENSHQSDVKVADMTVLERVQVFVANFGDLLDSSFEITERGSTIHAEVLGGFINFISCLYVIPVIPNQLAAAGYGKVASVEATALGCAVGSVLSSYITNLPFVIAPPTAVSIYLAVALQKYGIDQNHGDSAVILSGFALLLIGVVKPLSTFVTKLIPECIQASTAVGIGLITALAGLIELRLVVTGQYTILELGEITPAIVIAMMSVVVIASAMHFHVKGAFMLSLCFGTFVWWWYADAWPSAVFDYPHFALSAHLITNWKVISLLFNLIFLYILTLNGIARSLSDQAGLTNADSSIPRGNWLFIVCGLSTILSGYFSGPPILVSPESAAGIKAGSKTGLSGLVCGLLFGLSIFFCPILSDVPPAGTSPLLIVVGMMMFVNASRIRWSEPSEAVPAFFVLLLIPFTYSIIVGVGFGYLLYISIGIVTGQFYGEARRFVSAYHQTMNSSSDGAYQTILPTVSLGENDDTITIKDEHSSGGGGGGSGVIGEQRLSTIREQDGSSSSASDRRLSSSSISVFPEITQDGDVLSTLHDNVTTPLALETSSGRRSSTSRFSGFFSTDFVPSSPTGTGSGHRRSYSRGMSVGGGTRPRNGSIVDRLSMDMENNIQPMQAGIEYK